MGGMRLSKTTNTLVIIADYTKGLYHDKWIAGTLHYTGTGKIGDQDINQYQNKTLAESDHNGYTIHLFEVMEPGIYTYCGIVTLTENPYTETQPDDEGNPRTVWMFPVRPTPENDVKKPTLFTFENWDDYKEHAASAEERYARQLANKVTTSNDSFAYAHPFIAYELHFFSVSLSISLNPISVRKIFSRPH
mgnify:CR=1 FL=1